MGATFTNIHIRQTDSNSYSILERFLLNVIQAEGYRQVDQETDADISLYIYQNDSPWISISSDLLDFQDEESIQAFCSPLSSSLNSDVLAIGCFDSDFVYLNLINAKEKIDAWARVGTLFDNPFRRRTTPAAWRSKVTNLDEFKSALKTNNGFAEGCLNKIETLLKMSPNQSLLVPDMIPYMKPGKITTYHFAFPESKSIEAPKLYIPQFSLTPSWLNKDQVVGFVNRGGKSRGIGIQFTGNYVEHGDITFKDVQLEYDLGHFPRKTIPLKLEKQRTSTGEWIYSTEVNDFPIPEKVNRKLPPQRFQKEEFNREFLIRFTPEGNPNKILDISLTVFPLKYPELKCVWCVWHHSGSKREFILDFNLGQAEANERYAEYAHYEFIKPLFDPDDPDYLD
jgi:hypothetical protein